MKKKFNVLILFLLFFSSVFAGTPTFTARTSSTQVATGQQFRIQFTLTANGTNFNPPDLSNFRVLSGPNQSSSMSWINGAMSSKISYGYYLLAVKQGTFTIGKASIEVGGKTLYTNPITITVAKGRPVAQQPQQNKNQAQTNTGNTATANVNNKDLFIRVTVNKSKVYQGQPIIASYKLYTRVGLTNSDMVKMPDLTGFWSMDLLDNKKNVTWKTTFLNGERYNVAELKKVLLFPLHSGKLTIDPWVMNLTVRKRVSGNPRSIFDQFFGSYKNVTVKVKSNIENIDVLPLPDNNQPTDFNGMVGNYKVSEKVDRDSVTANNAVNLTITVSGTGNLKLISNPKLNFPKSFEVYDPQIKDHFTPENGNLVGSREFKYLIIPRYPGKYELDSVQFSFFNPETKKYKDIKEPPIKLFVAKGNGKNSGISTYTSRQKQDIAELGNDIRYIKPDTELSESGNFFWASPKFYACMGLPALLFLLAFGYKKKQEKDQSDFGKMQNRRANKMAAKYLSEARKQLKTDNKSAFYEAVLRALNNYLSNKLTIATASLTRDKVVEVLQSKQVNASHIEQLKKIMDECEMAQYAPIASKSNEAVLNNAANIIKNIEKEIRNA